MSEARQFEESDVQPLLNGEIDGATEEVLSAERLTPLIDKVIGQVDILKFQEELHLPNPEEVLHKVVEAAEQNQAIEKLLERSHEIKDNKSYQQLAAGPTVLSELIRAKTSALPSQSPSHKPAADKPHGRIRKLLHDNSLYGYAVRYGFVTALCSLVVAILVVWLFT
jgi:hypothetical protein